MRKESVLLTSFIFIILLFGTFSSLVFAEENTTTTTSPAECKSYHWFDDNSKACDYKEFCGAFTYSGLRTFEDKTLCYEELNKRICAQKENTCCKGESCIGISCPPGAGQSAVVEGCDENCKPKGYCKGAEECKYLYWFDNNYRECGYKQFCGAYVYDGLRTFENKEECIKTLELIKPREEIKEQVTCFFSGSNAVQKCYSSDSQGRNFGCGGEKECSAGVVGIKGEKLTWKSSCGGYGYTVNDGNNEAIKFDCSQIQQQPIQTAPVPAYTSIWFRNAYWKCEDGRESKEGGESSCKPKDIWYKYGKEFCIKGCEGKENCGIKEFNVYNECGGDITQGPVCGNGVCEGGEGEICAVSVTICKEGEKCEASRGNCKIVCPQDCEKQEKIKANLDEKFKLTMSQTAIFENGLNIKFNDLWLAKCGVSAGSNTGNVPTVATTGMAIAEEATVTAVPIKTETGEIGEEKEANEILPVKCLGKEPYAVLQIKYKEKTEVIKLQLGEKKKVFDFVISLLDYDAGIKSGVFLVSKAGEFACPENCVCNEKGEIIKCKEIRTCPENMKLCPDGICREECGIVEIEKCVSGCIYNNKCLPYGLRVEGLYCSIADDMKNQLGDDEKCENNFECKTNVCVDGKCLSSGFIQKILSWFGKLFGGE